MEESVRIDKPHREIIKWLIHHNYKTKGKNDLLSDNRHYGIGQICNDLKVSNTTPYYNAAKELENINQIKINNDSSVEINQNFKNMFLDLPSLKDVLTDDFLDWLLSPKKITAIEHMTMFTKHILAMRGKFSPSAQSYLKRQIRKISTTHF